MFRYFIYVWFREVFVLICAANPTTNLSENSARYDKFNDLISFVRKGDLRARTRGCAQKTGQMKWYIFLAKILYIYTDREGHSHVERLRV